MEKISGRLTVFFEAPFWVGVFERISQGKLTACKVTFGAQPGDGEVYAFILSGYEGLSFSPPVEAGRSRKNCSPKRRQREARRQLRPTGAGTKSQQALLRRQKSKEKHRGR